MYLGQKKQVETYSRPSKNGLVHEYFRIKTYVIFRCDCCLNVFERMKQQISPKRLSNNYFHCCYKCDSKKFAQSKGVERRKIWDMPASSELNISRI